MQSKLAKMVNSLDLWMFACCALSVAITCPSSSTIWTHIRSAWTGLKWSQTQWVQKGLKTWSKCLKATNGCSLCFAEQITSQHQCRPWTISCPLSPWTHWGQKPLNYDGTPHWVISRRKWWKFRLKCPMLWMYGQFQSISINFIQFHSFSFSILFTPFLAFAHTHILLHRCTAP